MEPEEITPLPINGELDLHTFRPNEIKTLIPDYLDACMEAGIEEVRIIHGKGTGQLREGVHRLLERLPEVAWRMGGNHSPSKAGRFRVLCRLSPPFPPL